MLKENEQSNYQECVLRVKFSPNWLGPYVIKCKHGLGAYHFNTLEGVEDVEPIDIIHIYPFHI